MIIPENAYIIINIAIVILYILFIVQAYRKGFLYELLSFFGFVATFFVSWFLSPILSKHFPIITVLLTEGVTDELFKAMVVPLINTLIWFVIIFIIVRIIISLILSIFKSISKIPYLGFVNRIMGTVFGVINATIWVIVLSMILSLPYFTNGNEVRDNTLIKNVSNLADQTIIVISHKIDFEEVSENFGEQIDDVDELREQFTEWLKEQGIIHE